jgi:hypothetical protein
VFSWQSLDLVRVIFVVGLAFLRLGRQEAACGLSLIFSGLRGLIFVVVTVVFVGAG